MRNNEAMQVLSVEEKELITKFLEWIFNNENTLKSAYNKLNTSENVYYANKKTNKSCIVID